MSLFRGERIYPQLVKYIQKSIGVGEKPGDGDTWYDATQLNLLSQMNGVQTSDQSVLGIVVSPVTATNPSATANLMSVALPANSMNVVGKYLRVTASGVYNFGGGTNAATLTFNVSLGATTILSFVSGATTNTATGMPWYITADIATLAQGTGGTVVADGQLSLTLGTNATAATTTYMVVPNGNTSFNMQSVGNVTVSALCSVASSTTNVVQQFMEVEMGN